jgi:hypothetical protein
MDLLGIAGSLMDNGTFGKLKLEDEANFMIDAWNSPFTSHDTHFS